MFNMVIKECIVLAKDCILFVLPLEFLDTDGVCFIIAQNYVSLYSRTNNKIMLKDTIIKVLYRVG